MEIILIGTVGIMEGNYGIIDGLLTWHETNNRGLLRNVATFRVFKPQTSVIS